MFGVMSGQFFECWVGGSVKEVFDKLSMVETDLEPGSELCQSHSGSQLSPTYRCERHTSRPQYPFDESPHLLSHRY